VKPAAERKPYAEREATLREFCTCHWLWRDQDGQRVRRERLWRDPKCALHGTSAKEAPF
jgi:hypothetical protein